LLDIKVKEKSVENLIRGREIYEPPRFMTVSQACDQLIQIINEGKVKKSEEDSGEEIDKN
jgi:diphthine synthase